MDRSERKGRRAREELVVKGKVSHGFGDLSEAASYRLCLTLMKRFRQPVPGVRISEIKVDGYSESQIRSCIRRLRKNHILSLGVVADVNGSQFRGMLVGLTQLGAALLESAPQYAQVAVEQARRLEHANRAEKPAISFSSCDDEH